MSNEKSQLFQDPHIDYPIDNSDLSFSDYILISRNIIAKNRLDLNQNNHQMILDANSPFEYRSTKPNHQGILLVHGLLDSPLMMQDLGRKLQDAGYLVRAILLPGHGTVPGALLNVTYEQWLAAVRYGVQSFKNEVEKVSILGFSLGAALALMQPNLKKYILLAPVFKIRSIFAFASNWHWTISGIWKRAAWFYVAPDEMLDYAKYTSIPFNAVSQVYQLTKKLQKIRPTAPCLFAVTQNDITVSTKHAIQYFKQHTSPESRMILYSPHESTASDSRIHIRPSIYPEWHISDFSHPSIPISPENFHYGKKGDYSLASHLPTKEKINYGEFNGLCLQTNRIGLHYGLISMQNRRLTFNPDFVFLSNYMTEFIQNC